MNDRFKFRVWSIANKKYCHFATMDLSADGLLRVIRPLEQSEYIDDYENRYVIQQSTSLKDKNGKLIYEGDILGGTYGNLYVHYCDRCKQFQLKANDYGCMACEGDIHWCEVVESEEQNELEVIGNIYENPELLESEG